MFAMSAVPGAGGKRERPVRRFGGPHRRFGIQPRRRFPALRTMLTLPNRNFKEHAGFGTVPARQAEPLGEFFR
jgi:hypothetical protein